MLWIKKKLRETTNLCVKIMNSKRRVKEKLGHVVQIRVWRCDVNVMLNYNLAILLFKPYIDIISENILVFLRN